LKIYINKSVGIEIVQREPTQSMQLVKKE